MRTSLEKTRRLINLCLSIGVLGLGSAGPRTLVWSLPGPEQRLTPRRLPTVEVLQISPVVFDAPIIGYGTVRPKRQVKIIPEVSGRLVGVHEKLAVGNVIPKGELLFEIDAQAYELKARQARAEIHRLETQLKRYKQQKTNIAQRLALAERQEKLAKESMDRERRLLDQDSGTAVELESAEERYLRQQEEVLASRSELSLIPLHVEETNAVLETRRAQLEEARLSIKKTKIYCPFNARVDAVAARKSQAVVAPFQIATLTDMEALELSVVIDPRDLRWIDQKAFANGKSPATAPEARVTWTLLGQEFSWRGRVMRLERMDETTRTAHVVVEIRDILPSVADRKGEHPTLLSVGMFCRAELPMEPLAGALVVPRHAIHDGQNVYVFVPDTSDANHGRLAIKHVSVLRRAEEDVLVAYRRDDAPADPQPATELDADGAHQPLHAGDRLVTSPLPKAVEGMRLALRAQRPTTVAEAGSRTKRLWSRRGTVLGTATGVR